MKRLGWGEEVEKKVGCYLPVIFVMDYLLLLTLHGMDTAMGSSTETLNKLNKMV